MAHGGVLLKRGPRRQQRAGLHGQGSGQGIGGIHAGVGLGQHGQRRLAGGGGGAGGGIGRGQGHWQQHLQASGVGLGHGLHQGGIALGRAGFEQQHVQRHGLGAGQAQLVDEAGQVGTGDGGGVELAQRGVVDGHQRDGVLGAGVEGAAQLQLDVEPPAVHALRHRQLGAGIAHNTVSSSRPAKARPQAQARG